MASDARKPAQTMFQLNTSINTKRRLCPTAARRAHIGNAFLGGLLMYICALLNPNILVANIQGIDVNLTDAMELLFTSGIIYYAGKDLKKLKDLLQIDSSRQEGGE